MEKELQFRDRVGVQDAVLLENYTDKSEFIGNLKKRFQENLIYTYIGQVLISVNPYKELNIYGRDNVQAYCGKHFFEVPPHVFAITDLAYRQLKEEYQEQCILISGESGAGKTEASKKILHYIAEVEESNDVEQIKNKLLESTILLETFGNAKTNKNDNSSRFGKYMDIKFNFAGKPVGGTVSNYLLEKSRVVFQAKGEKNFHIFYNLLSSAPDEKLEKLKLSRNYGAYDYLCDKENFEHVPTFCGNFTKLENSLSTLEFREDHQNEIFSILASILHIGNLKFQLKDEKLFCNDDELLKNINELLKVDFEEFHDAFIHRTFEARNDSVKSPLDQEQAMYAKDALSKAMYSRLFNWLVEYINKSLKPETTGGKLLSMGILDIYGFEIFQDNSFEQLCINFCNEKLQQLFIELTLKSEQQEYENEGIDWQKIDYFDNKIICDLIEEKHKGLIAYFDEECLRPGDSSDLTLLAKFDKEFSNHNHYISHEKADKKLQKMMGRDEFCLIHYAGRVTYNIQGFLDKNNDLLFRDLKKVMSSSSNNIIAEIFPIHELNSKRMPDTTITKFKNSLNDLLRSLKKKQPSYIRCIKPNDKKSPNIFDDQLVQHQVKYLGLMENLRVRRAGFAYRRLYEKFLQRYKCLSTKTWPNYHGSARDGVEELVLDLGYKCEDYKMGKTKIFIKHPNVLFMTEDAFQAKKHDIATIIQSKWKATIQRRKYLKIIEATVIFQKNIRRFIAKKHAEKRRKAVEQIRRFLKGFITRNEPTTELNIKFQQITRREWLIRLSKSLPVNVLDKNWPLCPKICEEASDILRRVYQRHLVRIYVRKLTPQRKEQFHLKVLAETLFRGKKKNYQASVGKYFVTDRTPEKFLALKMSFLSSLNGEKEIYSSPVAKYDRHGYKPRDRFIIVTNENLHMIDFKEKARVKSILPLSRINFVVTSENDKLVVVKIPDDLIKENKGDLIIEVPHVIEAITKIIFHTKNQEMLFIVDEKYIKHTIDEGKQGVIEIVVGDAGIAAHKNRNGHLQIISTP